MTTTQLTHIPSQNCCVSRAAKEHADRKTLHRNWVVVTDNSKRVLSSRWDVTSEIPVNHRSGEEAQQLWREDE